MPEVDVTGRVSEQAQERMRRIKGRVREKVSVGPGRMQLSPQEALARLQAMSGDERRSLIRNTGTDEFISRVEDLLDRVARGDK